MTLPAYTSPTLLISACAVAGAIKAEPGRQGSKHPPAPAGQDKQPHDPQRHSAVQSRLPTPRGISDPPRDLQQLQGIFGRWIDSQRDQPWGQEWGPDQQSIPGGVEGAQQRVHDCEGVHCS